MAIECAQIGADMGLLPSEGRLAVSSAELGVALCGQKQLGGIDHGTHSEADPAVFTCSPELLPIPLRDG